MCAAWWHRAASASASANTDTDTDATAPVVISDASSTNGVGTPEENVAAVTK